MAAFGLERGEVSEQLRDAVFEELEVDELKLADADLRAGHVEVFEIAHDEGACGNALDSGFGGEEFHAERFNVFNACNFGKFGRSSLVGRGAGRGLEDHRIRENRTEHGAGDILGRHKAEVVIHALENRIRAADGHDDDFERRGRGHVAELMVVNGALARAVFEIIGRLIEVGVVDDVHVLARDARHDFRRLQAETLKHEGGFRSRRSLGRSLDVGAALAVEVGAGDGRDDAVGIGVLMAENDGGHCDEAFLQNGEMQAFPEEYADGMFNLTIVGELQAP